MEYLKVILGLIPRVFQFEQSLRKKLKNLFLLPLRPFHLLKQDHVYHCVSSSHLSADFCKHLLIQETSFWGLTVKCTILHQFKISKCWARGILKQLSVTTFHFPDSRNREWTEQVFLTKQVFFSLTVSMLSLLFFNKYRLI